MSEAPMLWLVEDDPTCREILVETLGERFALRTFGTIGDLEAAAPEAVEQRVRLVIADVYLPDASFVAWVRAGKARRHFGGIPFLVMSSVDDVALVRDAFDGGAADFLSKPFGRAELRVKVERAVGLLAEEGSSVASGARSSVDTPSSVQLDAISMTVRRTPGTSVALTAKEMQVLALLLNAPERTLTRDALNAAVWRDCRVGRKTLDVHLSRLRRKLAEIGLDVRALPTDVIVLVDAAE